MTIPYTLAQSGPSRSFPSAHRCLSQASISPLPGAGLLIVGEHAGDAWRRMAGKQRHAFVLIELGSECLGVHTGEADAGEVFGFARFRLGNAQPSDLVELVRPSGHDVTALSAARSVFEAVGMKVAVCGDFPGRIIDRLVRPYYNAALRRLDEGLASADDMDKTLRLGLGYPEGPHALLQRTGLAHHYDISLSLYQQLGDPAYLPARRAQIARHHTPPTSP